MKTNIIQKLKDANLLGRGGAGFPTWIKWDAISKIENRVIYIVANGSEGEPGVFKDEFIIKNHPQEFIEGIKIALQTFPHSEAIIYLNHTYFDKYKTQLEKYVGDFSISFFRKTARYIAGEETALMSHIEGKRDEPRVRPPFPTESGLYGCPTLINNIETYYRAYEVANNTYSDQTFFSISGDVKNPGVFEYSATELIADVLKKSGNLPSFDYFVQIGGGAAGAIMLPEELQVPIRGAASIIVYNRKLTDPYKLMLDWAKFYAKENCDKCTPCRESSMRILAMVQSGKLDTKKLNDMFFVLEKTSFCPLGRGMPTPYRTLIEKLKLEL